MGGWGFKTCLIKWVSATLFIDSLVSVRKHVYIYVLSSGAWGKSSVYTAYCISHGLMVFMEPRSINRFEVPLLKHNNFYFIPLFSEELFHTLLYLQMCLVFRDLEIFWLEFSKKKGYILLMVRGGLLAWLLDK